MLQNVVKGKETILELDMESKTKQLKCYVCFYIFFVSQGHKQRKTYAHTHLEIEHYGTY